MHYLLLSVLFTTCWALSYKVASRTNCNLIGVNVATFFSASLLISVYIFVTHCTDFSLTATLIGVMGGVSLFIAILTFFYIIKEGELGPCWTIVSLSVVIPVFASIFIWAERPNKWQIVALFLICLSLVLLGDIKWSSRYRSKRLTALLAISFLCTGLCNTTTKMLQEMGLSSYRELYILSVNLSGFILILVLAVARRSLPGRKELAVGGAMGVAGMFNFLCFLLALRTVAGIVVFPVRDVGSLVLTTTVSCFIWKERINLKRVFGTLVAIIAIILINI